MRIYTKTGDNGSTSLYDGSRVSKDNIIIDCIGDLDELNSELGCILACYDEYNNDNEDKRILIIKYINIVNKSQSYLFDMGSLIAHPNNPESKNLSFDSDGENVKELEEAIDMMTELLPKLCNFILPGGNLLMSFIHKARTVCRRVERKLAIVKNNKYTIEDSCLVYINRLSDFLFTFARYVGLVCNCKEVIYKKSK